ncbi:MAG: xanthine dehydrogenase family protein subunit M [Chloroflexi bacterium]|nr:xanthine dehydrogenase family protein subunit M [Chloroflexota bacterium]
MAVMFEYRAAHSAAEAVSLLREHGTDAKIIAGGQSLMPLINLGLAQPSLLIDINSAAELDFITRRNGSLAIGALTRHHTVERSGEVRQYIPLLAEALPLIGDPQVRNRGTIGGSLAHADPVGEIPTVASCLGAIMVVQGPNGKREIPASEFFVTYLTTALDAEELLTEVIFPILPANTGVCFKELVRRQGDFAIVAAAAAVQLGADGACTAARLALAGVMPTPLNADAAASMLVGQKPTAQIIEQAAQAACVGIDPESDVIASADYRRAMAPVFARRALTEAFERAARA